MNLSAAIIKAQIQQILIVLRPISIYTKTKLDDLAVEILEAIEASDELLALIERYFGGEDKPDLVGLSDDTQIEWAKVEPFLPQLENILLDMQAD